MFSGIIEASGKVLKFDEGRLWIRAPFKKIQLGESIAVNGVCLTVADRRGADLKFDVGPETLRVTTLGRLRKDARVNLERALRVGDRLGGHWVTGHVEDTGRVTKIEPDGPNRWIYFQVPKSVIPYVVPKGSLSVDGISVTVVSIRKGQVKIMFIPHTLSHTTMGLKKVGDAVNLEPDILAKYVKGQSRS